VKIWICPLFEVNESFGYFLFNTRMLLSFISAQSPLSNPSERDKEVFAEEIRSFRCAFEGTM
jgi:hypothetical protein